MSLNVAHELKKANSLATNLEFECRQHMASNDFFMDEPLICDGKIKRLSLDANKSKKDEWYVGWSGLNDRGREFLTVVYSSYSDGQKYTFSSYDISSGEPTAQEKADFKREIEIRRQEAERISIQEREDAALLAQKIWQNAAKEPVSDVSKAYILLKKIEPHGARYVRYKEYDALIIPIFNIKKQIRSLQYIFLDEHKIFHKRFLSGGELSGNFFILCSRPLEQYTTVWMAEGWATAVSIYMAFDCKEAVICALNAGNLYKVASLLKETYSSIKIIVCADNDISGVGEREARKVVDAFGAEMRLASEEKDFNDIHVKHGLEKVKKLLVPEIDKPVTLDKNVSFCAFSLHLLPEDLRVYMMALCKATDAHPLMLLTSVLSMLAAELGNKIYIPRGEFFQDLYPNLWMLCISESGAFKTTALNLGSAIARKRQIEIKAELQSTLASMRLRKASDEDIKGEIISAQQNDILLPNRSTMESLLDRLETSPAGVIYLSEFGQFLKNMGKNYNADTMGTLTDLYDVPSAHVISTINKGERVIRRPAISICAVSTITWLKESFKESDLEGGFLVRFLLFAIPKSSSLPPALPLGVDTDLFKAEMTFEAVIKKIRMNCAQEREIRLTSSARLMYTNCYESISKDAASWDNPIYESFARRWCPEILKIATIIQILIDPASIYIDAPAIGIAYHIVFEGIKSTRQLINHDLSTSKPEQDAMKLLAWMCKRIGTTKLPIRKKDIIRCKQLQMPKNYKKPSEYYDDILQLLVDQGKIGLNKEKKIMDDTYYLFDDEK